VRYETIVMRTMYIDDVACPDAQIMRHGAKVRGLNPAADVSHFSADLRQISPREECRPAYLFPRPKGDCEKHNDIKGKRYDFIAQRPVADAPLFRIGGVIVRF
jgi:hypothetical protein